MREGTATGWRVRAAEVADLPALRRIFAESSLSNPGDAANLLAHPEALVLGPVDLLSGRTRVAVDEDGAVAGFATIAPAPSQDHDPDQGQRQGQRQTLELEDLFVAPDRMRRGAGSALIADVVALATAAGARRISVTANPHALDFYGRAGFVRDGDTTTPFGPAPRMHRDLS